MTLRERAKTIRNHTPGRGVMIPEGQLRLHKQTELFAVATAPLLIAIGIGAPLLWLWARILLVTMGVGVIVVDGWLLLQWDGKRRGPR